MDEINFMSRRPVILGRHGSVACADTRAAQIGLDVLKAGGNAADAAVAMAAALNVTLPMSCGIGGDAFCLFYDAQTMSVKALNGSGQSPAGLTLESVRSRGFTQESRLPETHGLAVTVPGAAAGLLDTVKHFGSGKLGLSDIFHPAITLAEEGFPVSQIGAVYWKKGGHLLTDKTNTYGKSLLIDGRPPRWGEVFTNPDLAYTYRLLASEGRAGYYTGPVAAAVVEAVTQHGGVMTLADLAQHRSTLEEAISTDFQGVRLWEVGPNTQGIVALMTLNILKHFNLKAMDHNSPEYLHHLIEALRLSFADAEKYVGDPSHCTLPVKDLLSAEYATQRSKLIDPHRALSSLTWGDLPLGSDTVYVTAVDRDRNACSFIMSNYIGFGTGIVPRGCGFTLQNRGYNFSLNEGKANVLAPGKRPYHTIIPAMVTDDCTGKLLASYGVMGGFMQPQGHVQVLLNMKLFAMNPQQALDQPRFCVGSGHRSPVGAVNMEEGMPQEAIEGLEVRGHTVVPVTDQLTPLFGRGHVITCGSWWSTDSDISNDSGVLWSGSDKRADGAAMAY